MNRSTLPTRFALGLAMLLTHAWLLGAAVTGCGTAAQSSCTVDEERIAQRIECVADDDCPCGAHCSAGLCAFDCRTASDCEAGFCDRFGRCVDEESPIGTIAVLPATRVRIGGAPLALDALHTRGVISITVDGDAPGPVRVRGDGTLVRCPGGEMGDECLLTGMIPGTPLPIEITTADPSVTGGGTVEIITDHGTETVTVTTGAPATTAPMRIEGTWEGNAYLVGAGSRARPGTVINSQALAELPMPVSATFYPEVAGVRPAALSSLDAIVFPESPTVGELRTGSGDALQLRHARRPFVTTEGDEGANVLASAQSTSVDRTEGTMTILLTSTYWGAATDAMSPTLHWRIVLRRTGDLPADATAPDIADDVVLEATEDRATAALGLETAARLTLADILEAASEAPPPELSEPTLGAARALCTAGDASVASSFTSATTAIGWSGDLLCREERAAAIGTARALALGPYSASGFDIATTIPGCVADLGRLIDARDGTPPTGEGRGCIDGPRFALALALTTAVDRGRAIGTASTPDNQASALAHRLVQQWAEMMAFVATQSVQIDRLNDVLGDGVGSTGIERDFEQLDMLEHTAAGWDLLLHPRIATAIAAMPGLVVARADYRPRIFPATTFPSVRYHDQGVGVPVALASALARTVEAHGALLDRSRYVTRDLPRAIELSHAFARRSLVLFALASALHEAARATSAEPLVWEQGWEHAASSYGTSVTALVRALELARTGGNPLGIDDELDLPLYRVGDETSPLARFSAVTDYLLGSDGSADTSPVGSAVAAAEARRVDARNAFSTALVREFAAETEESLSRRRIAAVSLSYGGDVVSLCGDPDIDTDAVVEGDEDVDENTCWIRPDCRRTGEDALAATTPGNLALGLCTARRLGERAAAALGPARAAAIALQTATIDALLTGSITARGIRASGDDAVATFSDGSTITLPAVLLDGSSDLSNPGGDVPPEVVTEIDAECRIVATASEAARPGEVPSTCTLNGDCPGGYLCRDAACIVDVGTDDAPSCYRGFVGELVVGLRGAVTDIEVARAELDEMYGSYGTVMRHCVELTRIEGVRESATRQFNSTMTSLGAGKLAAQVVANVAEAVQGCSKEGGTLGGIFSAGVRCGAAFTQAAAQSVVDGLDFRMEMVQRDHEILMSMLDADIALSECRLEADMQMVNLGSATLRIRRAMEEVAAQNVAIENAKTSIRVEIATGRAEHAREIADAVPPIEFDYWLNSTAVEYDAAFRRARRALYLGVLALEYEYQLSSSERTSVLAANSVSELRESLTRLRNLAATGTVGGAAPSPLLSVVSLRSELLALADRSDGPEGDQNLTDIERFRLLLASPRYATYAENGSYLGQEIPFRVAPFGAASEAGTVPIFAGEDCAERIWSMNASVLGTDVLVGSDSTRTRVTLRKRNTFFSQWCSPSVEETPFQLSATRPSINLFLDPTTDFVPDALDPRTGTFDALHEADAFASARLQPVLGVTRAELEADGYFNGSSRELAGRGLYGDYALFIPADSLSRDGAPGMDLSRVDDVLIRFDYVSVAR